MLSLIPKVQVPDTVAYFRPISCCNVLYKAIIKSIVHRLCPILERLISPSQYAFIPGRFIIDNVPLAQELFSRYNQQRLPPRCALKVDLRKAYDMVEWDFLLATLQLLGFPQLFIRWVECVTTAAFSVCLNDSIHGLFPGARGLRLGDPMSPYFFMLVMEEFANLSGLQANPAKSKLILSKSAHGNREALLQFLSFQLGLLPVCLPLDEDGLDIRDVQALNYALMSKHLWAVISNRDPSIWVQWVVYYGQTMIEPFGWGVLYALMDRLNLTLICFSIVATHAIASRPLGGNCGFHGLIVSGE
ncbi:UNVERIFIED_CONTAM: Transposon TX1 uncharacterized protein [Sesamum radiatum]|uniref:Transposon TX1 uncharacterized protein n=1 Tax=Sesamum radiatum TaxID=300843 RepID=A0AAW2SKR4_SESRA